MRGTHRGGCARVRGTTLGLGEPGREAVTLGVGPYRGLRMNGGLGVPPSRGVVRGRSVGRDGCTAGWRGAAAAW
jgi:hypothetical protein